MESSTDLHTSPSTLNYLKPSDCTNLLLVSCDTLEPLEQFKLSTLNSPMFKIRYQREFAAFSESTSTYPDLNEAFTAKKSTEKKKGSAAHNLDLFLDSALKKRDGYLADEEEEELAEYNLNFIKQMHRVKYSWRGTSLTQPFTFMRVRREGDNIVCEEDYSNKKVNLNDGLFN